MPIILGATDFYQRVANVAKNLGLPKSDRMELRYCFITDPGRYSFTSFSEIIDSMQFWPVENLQSFLSFLNIIWEHEFFVKSLTNCEDHEALCEEMGVRPKYTTCIWLIVKNLQKFQTLLERVTFKSVFSSKNSTMVSLHARQGFYFRCVKHGINPRLKLATMSPGVVCFFLRRILRNAAENGQSRRDFCWVFRRCYYLHQKMLSNI